MSLLPRLVILPTDALFWLVIALGVLIAVVTLRDPVTRGRWRQVWDQPFSVVSATVLLCFVVISLCDSIHFERALPTAPGHRVAYSPQVLSVLDVALSDLRRHQERSYSAPFALHGLSPETVLNRRGEVVRRRPRLRWAGPGVANDEARWHDIMRRALTGALWGAIGGLCAIFGLRRAARRKPTLAGPLRAAGFSFCALFVVVGMVASLAAGYHVLGTDQVGLDVLYKCLKSVRTGVVIGTLTTLTLLPLAIGLGTAAGYFGGLVDDVVQYLYTTLNSIPGVLLIAAAVLTLDLYAAKHAVAVTGSERADQRLLSLCLILGLTSWTGLCRLLRAETLKIKTLDYVQAAKTFGAPDFRIITRHVLPNVMHLVMITVVLDFSGLVLAEAVLTYVGVGVDPTMQSFGNMIESARLELARTPVVWWNLAGAFGFLSLLVLSVNLLADAVRTAFDPRTERGGRS